MSRIALTALGLAAAAAANASFTNMPDGGGALYSVGADTNTSAFPLAASIVARTGGMGNYGSGTLYDVSEMKEDGQDMLCLNFVTADHVVSSGDAFNVRIPNGLGGFYAFDSESPGWEFRNYTRFDGKYGVDEDLAWLGFAIPVADFAKNKTELDYLLGLQEFNNLDAAAPPAAGDTLVDYGYGLSGRYLVQDVGPAGTRLVGMETVGPPPKGHTYTVLGFRYQRGYGNADQQTSRTERTTDETVSRIVDDYKSQGGKYEYDSIQWTASDQAGYGAVAPGDSGGGIFNADEDGDPMQLIGVNTYAATRRYGNQPGTIDELYGSVEGGLMFTQADVDWLTQQEGYFCATPEPAGWLGLSALFLGLLARSRRRR